MEIENFFKCQSCGRKKSKGNNNKENPIYCTECILDLNFHTTDLDQREIDKHLQKILDFFVSDVSSVFNKDPAAHTLLEVLTSYPGIKAVLLYRIAHFFWKLGMPFVPRYISNMARDLTGIEIHPGAEIGSEFFIDHGAGVVIGETSVIGNNVTIYAGVVLGGVSTERVKRHPTLGNDVVVGTGAKLLGAISIGNNVRVGSNSVVVNDVPSNSVVVGVPGRIVSREGEKIKKIDLRHGDLPDPLAITVSSLNQRILELEKQVFNIKKPRKEETEIFFGEYGSGI